MLQRPENWKSVKDPILKWEKIGQSAEGVYRDVQERDFGERTGKLYTLNGDGDQMIRFWGTTVLDQHMARVPKGVWVQIIYQGEAGQGNRCYKDFEVKVGKGTELVTGREDDVQF